MASAAPPLRCRQIEESDFEAIAALLARGFPTRNRQFWLGAFAQLRRHATPQSLPKYGYLLESGGRAVGAVLLICSLVRAGEKDPPRCNLSSWYVDPAFRAYAPMLVSQALRHKDECLARAAHVADHRGAGLFSLLRRHVRRCSDDQRFVRRTEGQGV